MEHGAKAAKAYSKLIKQTAPKGDQPGRNRSLVIGTTPTQPVVLVSPKKPTSAVSELKTMSKKLGTVTPIAISQVVFEEGEVHLKVLKAANEMAVKKAFLGYYNTYKVSPPSLKVKLWQPGDWEPVEFEEDPDDTGEVSDDDSDEEDAPDESGEGSDEPADQSAEYHAKIMALGNRFKQAVPVVGNDQARGKLLQIARIKLAEASQQLKNEDYETLDGTLTMINNALVRATGSNQVNPQNAALRRGDAAPDGQSGPVLGRSRSNAGTDAPPMADLAQAAKPQGPSQPQASDTVAQQPVPDPSLPFKTEAAKVKDLLGQAKTIPATTPISTGLHNEYLQQTQAMAQAVQSKDWAGAMTALQKARVAARRLVLSQQVSAGVAQKQVADQRAQYDDMAPVLDQVTKTYFNPNAGVGSARLAKESLSAGTHFKAYMRALATLEGLKSAAGTPPSAIELGNLKTAAQAVLTAAQSHLDHYERDLSTSEKKDKKALRKKQICEEGAKAARQYLMALELQTIGAPTTAAPWTPEQQIKVNGLRAQFSFESGYKKGSNLGGAGGQSAAYWVESQPLGAATATKNFIFKPTSGESTVMGAKKGAGAAKESLASAQAKLFEQQTGINLGVPETSVATIAAHAIDDTNPATAGQPKIGSMQEFAAGTKGSIEDQPPGILRRVDPSECQRAALNDIMGLNVDRHAGNFMVNPTGGPNGGPKLVPIDHGETLPPPDRFKALSVEIGGMGRGSFPKNALLSMPGSYEKFSADMQDRIALIDPDALATGMTSHLAALDRVNPGLNAAQKVSPQSIELSKRVTKFLKKAAPQLSPAEIQIAIAQNADIFTDFNQDIEQVADRIIQAAAPKGPGYAEFFKYSNDQRRKISRALTANGWGGDDFIMGDPVAALKLYKGNVVKGADDAGTAAGRVDMLAARKSGASRILADTQAMLAETDPADRAALSQRHQQLSAIAPADEREATDLEQKAQTLYLDTSDSCLGALREEATTLYQNNKDRFPITSGDHDQFDMAYRKGVLPSASSVCSIADAKMNLKFMKDLVAKLAQAT